MKMVISLVFSQESESDREEIKSAKSQLRDILYHACSVLLKTIKVIKTMENQRDIEDSRSPRIILQFHMMGIPLLDPEIRKDSKQQLSFDWEHGSVQGQSALHTMHIKYKDQSAPSTTHTKHKDRSARLTTHTKHK